MRRSMKPSEEEKESKVPSTRRARSLLSISEITLRRSSRLSKVMDNNPPEPSENPRVTRSRASTVDRELGTPSSARKRSFRAGSETKTMTPGRVLRKTRTPTSSSEDTSNDDVHTWKPYESSWNRRRLSMLPSEPSIAEEVQKSKSKEICVIYIDDDPIDLLSSTEKMPVTLDVEISADQVSKNSTEAPTFPDPSSSTDTTTSSKKNKSNGCDEKPKRRSLMLLRREKEMNKDDTCVEYHFSENNDKIVKKMERESENSVKFVDSVIVESQSRHVLKDPPLDTSVTIVEEIKTTVKNKALVPKELSVTVEKLATDRWISSGKENTNPTESIESKSDFVVTLCDSLKKSSRNMSTQDSGDSLSENNLSDLEIDIWDDKSKEKENIQKLNAIVVLKDILDVRHQVETSGKEEKAVTSKKQFNISIRPFKELEISKGKDEANFQSEIENGDDMDGNGDDFDTWYEKVDSNNSTEAEERSKEASSIEKEKSFPGKRTELSLKSQEIEETAMEISTQKTTVAVINVEENSETKKFEEENQKSSSPTISPGKALESPKKEAESPMRAEISPIGSESSIDTPISENSEKKSEEILGKELEKSPSATSICSLETIIYEPTVENSQTPLTQNSLLKKSTATTTPSQLNYKLERMLDLDVENVRNNSETLTIAEESPGSLNLQFEFESENISPSIKSEVLQSEIDINENPLVKFPEDKSPDLNLISELKQENLTPSSTTKEIPVSLKLKSELEKIPEVLIPIKKCETEDSEIEIEDTFLEFSPDLHKKTNPENLSFESSLSEEENNTLGDASKLKGNGQKKDLDIENGRDDSLPIELQSEVEIKAKSSKPVLEVSREKIPENLNLKVEVISEDEKEDSDEMNPLPELENRSLNMSSVSGRTSEKDSDIIEIENSLPKFLKSLRKSILQSEINKSDIVEDSGNSDNEMKEETPNFPSQSENRTPNVSSASGRKSNKESDIEIENEVSKFEEESLKKSPRKSILQSEINKSDIVEDSDNSDNEEETSNFPSQSENRTPNVSSASERKSDKESDIEIENEVSKFEEESLKKNSRKSILQSEINKSDIVEDSDNSDNEEETSNFPSQSENRIPNVSSASGRKNDKKSDIEIENEVSKFEEESLKKSPRKLSEELKEKSVPSRNRQSRTFKFIRLTVSDSSDEETEALENIVQIEALKVQEKESLRLKKELENLILQKELELLKLREELTPELNELNENSIMEVVDLETHISPESENRESSIVTGPPSKQTDGKEENLKNLFKDITKEEFNFLRKNPSNLKGTEEDPVLLDDEVDELSQSRKKTDDSILILDDLQPDKNVSEELSQRKRTERLSIEFVDEIQPVKNRNISKSAKVSPSSNGGKKSNAPVVRKIEVLKNAIEIESLKQNLREWKIKENEKEGENKKNKKNLNQTENSKLALKQTPFKQTPELIKLFSTENIKGEKTQKGLRPIFFMNFTSSEEEDSDFSIDTDAAMEYNLPGERWKRNSSSDLEESSKIDFIDVEAEKCKFEKIEESKSALEEKEKKILKKKIKKNKEEKPEVSADLAEKGDDSSMSKKKKKKQKKEEPEIREEERLKKKKIKKNKEEKPEVSAELEEREDDTSMSKKKKKQKKEEPEERQQEILKKNRQSEEENSKKKKRNKEEEPDVDEDIVKEKKKKKKNQKEDEVGEKEVKIEVKPKKEKKRKDFPEEPENKQEIPESKKKKNKKQKKGETMSEEIPKIEEDRVLKKKKDKIDQMEEIEVKRNGKESKKEMPVEILQFDSVSSEKSDKKKRRKEKTQVEFELQVSEPKKKRSKKEDEKESKNQQKDIQEQEIKIQNQERRIKDQELKIKVQEKAIRDREMEINLAEKKKKSKPEPKVENVDKKSIRRLPQEILESLSDLPQESKRQKLSNLNPPPKSTKPKSKKDIGKGLKTAKEEIIESPSDLPKQKIYVPSLSMIIDTELREHVVETENPEISYSGSTSKFLVSNVAILSSKQSRAERIRNFRDSLLKRRVKRV